MCHVHQLVCKQSTTENVRLVQGTMTCYTKSVNTMYYNNHKGTFSWLEFRILNPVRASNPNKSDQTDTRLVFEHNEHVPQFSSREPFEETR